MQGNEMCPYTGNQCKEYGSGFCANECPENPDNADEEDEENKA